MVNQHGNDDIYVEMTFLASMDKYGLDVSIRQAGIDFANSGYTRYGLPTVQAGKICGRELHRRNRATPQYTNHCDDIDYQIESDYSGILAPGMPNQFPLNLVRNSEG